MSVLPKWHREKIRVLTAAALQSKKSRGERVGAVPYGYRVDASGVQLEEEPAEQAVIRLILGLRQIGKSIRAIEDELARDGITSRDGGRILKSQIKRVFDSAPDTADTRLEAMTILKCKLGDVNRLISQHNRGGNAMAKNRSNGTDVYDQMQETMDLLRLGKIDVKDAAQRARVASNMIKKMELELSHAEKTGRLKSGSPDLPGFRRVPA